MINTRNQKTKAEILEGMMRDKNTAKLIKEAISSPVGSTARERAQKTFKIINKLHEANQTYDGQGGPGMMYQRTDAQGLNAQPIQNGQASTPKSIVIFKKIPTPNITYGNKIIKKSQNVYDGTGGPGILDGKGGMFSDLGSALSSTLSTFATPFTDFISGGSTSAGNNAASTSAYNITPTSPAEKTGSSVLQSLNYLGNPIGSLASDAGTSIVKAITSPKQTSSTYQPGLLSKASNWVANTAYPALNNAAGSALYAVPAATQWVGQNVISGIQNARNAVFGYDPATDAAPLPSISLGDTWGGQQINNLWPNYGTNNTANPAGTTNPSAEWRASHAPTTGPAQQYPNLAGQANDNPFNSPYFKTGNFSTKNNTNAPTSGTNNSYTPTAVPTGSSNGVTDSFIQGLLKTEGADYGTPGKVMTTGPHAGYAALGKYQIMPDIYFPSIGLDPNSEADKQTFLNSPALQDKVFNSIMSDLSKTYNGDQVKMAAAYFGGPKGAANVGTPAGDIQGDGHMSVNQYVASVLGGGAGSPSAGSYSSIQAAAKASNAGGMTSPAAFAEQQMANPNDPVTHGKSLVEAQIANKDRIWGEKGLIQEQADIEKLQKEIVTLPKDMKEYITARDQYIRQTDKAIDEYTAKMQTMDLSNPVKARESESYLNYLYTLRGRQNQTYSGYINDAVTQHQQKTNDMIVDYNKKLTAAETELTSANAMTLGSYNTHLQALQETMQGVNDAPVRAAQLLALQRQSTGASGTGAKDQVSLDKQIGYFTQFDKLKGTELMDKNGLALPGINLMSFINKTADPYSGDTSMSQAHIIRAYEDALNNTLVKTSPETDALKGSGITRAIQLKVAEESIKNFAQLAATGVKNNNAGDVNEAINGARASAKFIQDHTAGKISTYAPALMDAVQSFAPKGWFSTGATPSFADFAATVKNATNSDPISEQLAGIIYDELERVAHAPGSTAAGAVTSFLDNTIGTTDRANLTPFSTDTFAMNVARLYAESMMANEFGISTIAQGELKKALHPPA